LGLGLLGRRPALRVVARRPGFVACLAASLFSLYFVATFFLPRTVRDPDSLGQHYLNLLFTLSFYVGPAIAGAWLVQGLMGRRFLSTTGVEFLGCLVGLGWLGMFLITTMLPSLTTLVELL
jgi:hypothetical protein